ncbi:MAG: DsbA family oxidoreductase [Pseudomonadota bacterium]
MSETEQTQNPISIDVVSDVMCPWCYIGKRRLEQALSLLGDTVAVDVRWRPYQLDPTLPKEGKDRRLYLEQKFGGPEKAKEIYSRIEDAGRAEDLDFKFSAIKLSSNTLDAHRVIRWSSSENSAVRDALIERLFQFYFMEGGNLGDTEALVQVATDAGMDGSVVAALLATDKDRAEVEQEIAMAQQMGVTGVPCFIINNKYAVMGAQEAGHIAEAVRQAAAETGSTAKQA